MRYFKLFFIMILVCIVPVVIAQESCSALVTTALEMVSSACDSTSRNQACYGYRTLTATAQPDAEAIQFEQAGDREDIAAIRSLQLSPLSLTDEAWGIALMKVQANLPDTVPGQNVTFLLFGDVAIRDAGSETIEIPVTANNGVNVRLRPTTSAAVIHSLRNGDEVIAIGRLDDRSWVQVRLDATTIGWVSADFLNGNVDNLAVIEPDADTFGAMQAFYFTSGIRGTMCEQAPDSGILIQSPDTPRIIHLRANEVDIELGSTLFLQAIAGDALYVYVLEGHATLTSFGVSQLVPAGTFSTVPLDDEGIASGAPTFPQAYLLDLLENLPLSLLTPITIAAPVEDVEAAIAELNATVRNAADETDSTSPTNVDNTNVSFDLPPSGTWMDSSTVTQNTCGPETLPIGLNRTSFPTFTFNADHSAFTVSWGDGNVYTYTRSSGSTYTIFFPADNGYTTWTLTFTSSTTFVGQAYGVAGDPDNGGCVFIEDRIGSYVP